MTLYERIQQARQAQQDYEQRHDVQLEIPDPIVNRDPGDETQED